MSAGRLGWAIAGTIVLVGIVSVIFRLQPRHSFGEKLALRMKKIELTGQLGLALASATEAEKSAVLATTDEQSEAFAQQARSATSTAEQARAALHQLLQIEGTSKEKELLLQFSKAFTEFRHVDDELLALAVKNTNLKATALTFGASADAIGAMDAALSRILNASVHSTAGNAKRELFLAASAQAAAMRIQALLPPHIAEEADAKMDELEARMAKQDREVRNALSELAAIVPARDADLALATSSYARFTELKTQILKLSRENTNVRSLALSLNEKRKVTVLCEDALAALRKEIEDTQAKTMSPARR
jgi:Four helix bundle sensory module for signal transduction